MMLRRKFVSQRKLMSSKDKDGQKPCCNNEPITVPRTVFSGERLSWIYSNPDYKPSNGWTLKYSIFNMNALYCLYAKPYGDSFKVSVSGAETLLWKAGEYMWKGWVENINGDTYDIGEGKVTVVKRLTDSLF